MSRAQPELNPRNPYVVSIAVSQFVPIIAIVSTASTFLPPADLNILRQQIRRNRSAFAFVQSGMGVRLPTFAYAIRSNTMLWAKQKAPPCGGASQFQSAFGTKAPF